MKIYQIKELKLSEKTSLSLVPVVKVFLLFAVSSHRKRCSDNKNQSRSKDNPLNALAGCLRVLEDYSYIPSSGLENTCYAWVIFCALFWVSSLPPPKSKCCIPEVLLPK